MTAIGPVQQSPAHSTRGSAYAQLSKLVKDAGLLDRRPGYYIAKIILTLLAASPARRPPWRGVQHSPPSGRVYATANGHCMIFGVLTNHR